MRLKDVFILGNEVLNTEFLYTEEVSFLIPLFFLPYLIRGFSWFGSLVISLPHLFFTGTFLAWE